MRIVLAFLAISLMAQDATAPPKTVEQQLSEAKAENEHLNKLLNVWVQKSMGCEVALTTAQTLGTPPTKPERPR